MSRQITNLIRICALAVWLGFGLGVGLSAGTGAAAAELGALARADQARSSLSDAGKGATLTLRLSQPVPFRIFTLDAPMRMVIDFNEVDWSGFDATAIDRARAVGAARVGALRPGWSRMVLDLDHPLALRVAQMTRLPDGAELELSLIAVDAAKFAAGAGAPEPARPTRITRNDPAPKQRQTGQGPLVVVIDPGHGGIDPGAESGADTEADLVLTFARELREMLLRAGGFHVVMTRNEDSFVPLEERISIARAAGADVFLSLHADAIAEGLATGASVYTLSETASDVASRTLAERHDRADLLAGIDLSAQDDKVASVLMDLARTETTPRSDALAQALVLALSDSVKMHKRPRHEAGFSVLKAPDIPSVLVELGYLSSPSDLKRLKDSAWRAKAAWAIREALSRWAEADALEARLLRR